VSVFKKNAFGGWLKMRGLDEVRAEERRRLASAKRKTIWQTHQRKREPNNRL
jgi:hypothetical protein